MNVFSEIYGLAVSRRNRRYDERIAEIIRVDIPVVSVGNISVGGTGKTPFVQYVVRELLALGRRPAVVSRGYGRKSRGEVIVSDGKSILASVEQSGDELMLHAESLPVPVIANADRVEGAYTAQHSFGVDVVVLDDGFQHRRLYRDCDIVLVDRATLDHSELIPAGRLREPLRSLCRADVVCAVGGVACTDIPSGHLAASALCIEAVTEAGEVRNAFSQEAADLQKDAVVAVAGIAQPDRFFASLAGKNIAVAGRVVFGDHYNYREKDVRRILEACAANDSALVITTEKDAVKLRRFRTAFDTAGVQLVVLPVATAIAGGGEKLRHKLSSLFELEKR